VTQPATKPDATEILPGLATQATRGQRFLALSLLGLSALFSGVVVGGLVVTYLEESATGYPESALLKELQLQIDKDPRNETLKTLHREEDLRIRQAQDARRRRVQVGAWLLLAGLAAAVVSGRWYASLDAGLPAARKAGQEPNETTGLSPRARGVIAVTAVGVLLVATLVVMNVDWTRMTEEVSFRDNWPRFRGPTGMGVVPAGDWPRKWDAASGENILWKTQVPLPGKSSPVVWGRRIFLSAGDAKTQKVFCYDRTSGALLWETNVQSPETRKLVEAGPEEGITMSEDTGYAAPTPVTDGKRLYVVFVTADVAAVDFSGRVAWVRNLGKPENTYGLASSLAIYKDTVIFQFDQGSGSEEGKSALLGLDAATGSTVWRTERPVGSSWSSPLVAATDNGTIIVTCGAPWVIAYEPEFGGELWRCEGLAGDVAVSPVYAAGMVYVTNDAAQVMAIRTGGKGDVTKTHVVWAATQGMPDAASPISDGRFFLQAAASGEVTCFDAAKGNLLWSQSFDGGFWSSPMLVGDVVYATDMDGKTTLFKLADKYEVLGENKLGETVHATPAFSGGHIFFRGTKHLFAVGGKK